jgi:hypothetical protein
MDEHDFIGPLGPHLPEEPREWELGRFPIVIEGKQVAEYSDLECTEFRRSYSYAKPETGDGGDNGR